MTLALAYARAKDRPVFEDLFALDRRLADAVRQASEPIIAQLKLAWWRDRFAQDPSEWPKGEPLLARLADWNVEVAPLGALVDGWEALLADGALDDAAIRAFGEGRMAAWALTARVLGAQDSGVGIAAFAWSCADLAQHCASHADRERVRQVAQGDAPAGHDAGRLPRALRPLAVLATLGRRSLAQERPLLTGAGDFFAAVRTGMLGR